MIIVHVEYMPEGSKMQLVPTTETMLFLYLCFAISSKPSTISLLKYSIGRGCVEQKFNSTLILKFLNMCTNILYILY